MTTTDFKGTSNVIKLKAGTAPTPPLTILARHPVPPWNPKSATGIRQFLSLGNNGGCGSDTVDSRNGFWTWFTVIDVCLVLSLFNWTSKHQTIRLRLSIVSCERSARRNGEPTSSQVSCKARRCRGQERESTKSQNWRRNDCLLRVIFPKFVSYCSVLSWSIEQTLPN